MPRPTRIRSLPLALLLACALPAALLQGGCGTKKRTQLTVGVLTDMKAPDDFTSIVAEVTNERTDEIVLSRTWPISGRSGEPYEIPGSFVLFSRSGDGTPLKVVVKAVKEMGNTTVEILRRTAVLSLVEEETLFLRMSLVLACVSNADCPEDKTCIEGRCRTQVVDPRTLPVYTPGLERVLTCKSGPQFRNTGTQEELAAERECGPDEICSEGTCLKRPPGATPGEWRVEGVVVDRRRMPVAGARVVLTEGRTALGLPEAARAASIARAETDAQGRFALGLALPVAGTGDAQAVDAGAADPAPTELLLTVQGPATPPAGGEALAPQIVSVPLKPSTSRYLVPVTLVPFQTAAITAARQELMAMGPAGITAKLTVPASPATDRRLRYALLDPHAMPARVGAISAAKTLQSAGVFFLELVDAGGRALPLPPLQIDLLGYPFRAVLGAETIKAYRLDAQATWVLGPTAVSNNQAVTFTADANGFWSLSRAITPACARGRVLRKGGGAPCAGVRVEALGPQGIRSFDSTAESGAFCLASAPGQAATLFVGGVRRNVYMPAAAAVCEAGGGGCADLGTIELEPAECATAGPPTVPAAPKAIGASCVGTSECAPTAVCDRAGFCTTDGPLRVSLRWTAASDFDLHVLTPGKKEISPDHPEEREGHMDVHQCRVTCEPGLHVENIVLGTPSPGTIEVWARNENGRAEGTFEIEVTRAGERVALWEGSLPATAGAASQRWSYEIK